MHIVSFYSNSQDPSTFFQKLKLILLIFYITFAMSNFDKIFTQFKKLGYNEESFVQQAQIIRALDSIVSQNTTSNQFDRNIAQQLWTHSNPDRQRGVKLQTFINSIVEAEAILREQVGITQQALKFQNRPAAKAQLQDQYSQIIADHNIITAPFRLTPLRQIQSQPSQASRLLQNKSVYQSERMGQSAIFSYDPNPREESSSDLRVCLIVSVAMLFIQLVLMFHKHHFLNLLCILGILSIYLLNYFDKNYIKFLLILITTSIIYDVVWLGVNAKEYWKPEVETQHSDLHTGFLIFIFIMVIIMGILKIVCAVILFKYRQNGESTRKSISIFGYRIKLDGKPTYNPFSPLLRSVPNVGL